METFEINNLVNIVVGNRKSSKGNEYNGIFIQILDKDNNVVLEKMLDFLTNSQYEKVLSLLKK